MDDKAILERWLGSGSGHDSVDVVKRILVKYFGADSLVDHRGGSHQLRVKHPALAGLPEFGPYGFLSIPVSGGTHVKKHYLRRIAQAVRRLEEVAQREAQGDSNEQDT